jgi:uncharacterized phosphosugar-binding protein
MLSCTRLAKTLCSVFWVAWLQIHALLVAVPHRSHHHLVGLVLIVLSAKTVAAQALIASWIVAVNTARVSQMVGISITVSVFRGHLELLTMPTVC